MKIYLVGAIDRGPDYVANSFEDAKAWVEKADQSEPQDWYIDECNVPGTTSTVATLKHRVTTTLGDPVWYGRKN